jgi:hypothetical protein
MVEVFVSNKNPYLHLFIRNLPENPNSINVVINNNSPLEFCGGCWYLLGVNLGEPLIVKVMCDGVETVKEFGLTEEDKLVYSENGYIKFN